MVWEARSEAERLDEPIAIYHDFTSTSTKTVRLRSPMAQVWLDTPPMSSYLSEDRNSNLALSPLLQVLHENHNISNHLLVVGISVI
jgi:hypothetical protein